MLIKTRNILLSLVILTGSYFLLARFGFIMPISKVYDVFYANASQSEKTVHLPIIKGDELLNINQPLKEILKSNIQPDKVAILIEKSKYRLTVFYNLQPVKSYRVVLGENPTGDKLHEGDKKTPEGIYHVRDLYFHPQWSRFIWLDYPTAESWRKHLEAKATGKINLLLPVGGDVGIHGVPTGQDSFIDQKTNWTWGCISLKTADINEIYDSAKIGTLVEIVP